MKTLRRTPSLRSLQAVLSWEWESEEELLYYLYWSGHARRQLISIAEAAEETVIFCHPLLQSGIALHPRSDTDYVRDLVEYELSVHYPQFP